MESRISEQIKYHVEKAGYQYDPDAGYTLAVPRVVGAKLAEGMHKVASFEPYLGEELVILAAFPPAKAGGK